MKNLLKEVLLQVIENERKELPFSLTVKELKNLLRLSNTKIYELLISGEIPGKKISGKWIVQTSQFLAWFHETEQNEKSKIEDEVIV